MLRAVLVDDEPMALDMLEITLRSIGGVEVVGRFINPRAAIAALPPLEADIVLLDIEMPELNGIATAEQMIAICPTIEIIFVTAYSRYAVEAFEANALDYLLKPISQARLRKTMERYIRYRGEQKREAVEVLQGSAGGCMYINVMGNVEVYNVDGQLVKWRTRKVKELFAYLWHHQGAPVQRNKIIEDLWADMPNDRVHTTLHTTLYQVRTTFKQLGYPGAVTFANERYRLKLPELKCDLAELEQLMEASWASHERLVELYRGDYMEEGDYAWAGSKRDQVRSAYIRTLEGRCLEGRCGEEMEMVLKKLIELEPYAEKYYLPLLQHYGEEGRLVAFRRLYGQMLARFKGELGIPPSSELVELASKYI